MVYSIPLRFRSSSNLLCGLGKQQCIIIVIIIEMFNVARLSKICIISRAKSEKCRSVSFLVLSHITPPHIRRIAATNQLLSKIRSSTVTLPLISDIESHPEARLTSRHPVWLEESQQEEVSPCQKWTEK